MSNQNDSCNECEYQEEYFGEKICKHIQSMKGLEAFEEYVKCDEVNSCEYFYAKE